MKYEKNIQELIQISKNRKIKFAEKYYKSEDNKTTMGEVSIKQILFLNYKETEAGSNPREFIGLKKSNIEIFESLLQNYDNLFRFLHSGIIVSIVNPKFLDEFSIQYEDCCLTNGNQTRFIILIITFLKLISENIELSKINKRNFQDFMNNHFQKDVELLSITQNIYAGKKFRNVSNMINKITKTTKLLELFKEMNLNNFLDTKIRIQINVINEITDDNESNSSYNFYIGTQIAEANNDTQNVKADDIFGTKRKEALNEFIFNNFNEEFNGKVQIEFRFGEIGEGNKVHILTLFRLVVATGILTKYNEMIKLTNQRLPIYKIFERLLNKKEIEKTKQAVSKLIPLLYIIRKEYIEPYLLELKRTFIRSYKTKASAGELDNTIIGDEINRIDKGDQKLESLIKSKINFNIEHITPVLIFRIKNLIKEENGKLTLTIKEQDKEKFFKGMIEAIYEKYIEMKLGGIRTSLTTEVRDRKFYEFGKEAYITSKRFYNLEETDYIKDNSHIIR